MKNKLVLILLLLCCFSLVGCGEEEKKSNSREIKPEKNKLSCSSESLDDDIVVYEFKDDKVYSVTLITFQESESEKEAQSTAYLFDSIANTSETDGIKYTINADEKDVVIKTIYIIDKLTAEERIKLTSSGLSVDNTKEEIKKEMESHEGVICK